MRDILGERAAEQEARCERHKGPKERASMCFLQLELGPCSSGSRQSHAFVLHWD